MADNFIHNMCTGVRLEVHRYRGRIFWFNYLIFKGILELFTGITVLNNYNNLIISNNY